MPPAIGSIGVEMKDQEIWQVITYLRSVQVKTPPSTGNPAHGKALFYGAANCSKCHMVEGKGGRLGPDLTGIAGSRSIESMHGIRPRAEPAIVPGYQTVTVVTADGKEAKGFIMNEDRFSASDDGHQREDPVAGKRQVALFSEKPGIVDASLHHIGFE